MTHSRLDYAREYEVCEQENLTTTGLIQAGFYLVARHDDGTVTHSGNLKTAPADLLAVLERTPVQAVSTRGYGLRHTDAFGSWLHHRSGDADIYEQAIGDAAGQVASEAALDPDALKSQSHGNIFKACQLLCRALQTQTGADRVMVYRFTPDWSGEVIAESVERHLDAYLGLHYPPTDIPRQARALYVKTGARHIFSIREEDTPLIGPDGRDPLDLSLAASRNVSPYHIEYLDNMGSESTASCALVVRGVLWGLISLHYGASRPPSLVEIVHLQTLAQDTSALLEDLLEADDARQRERLATITSRFSDHLSTQADPFQALLLSNSAAHRLLGGQGASLLIDNQLANVGRTPSPAVIGALAAHYGATLSANDTAFVETFEPLIPADGRHGLAGCAITRLSAEPNILLLVYRAELNQQVKWGGDPRRQAQTRQAVSVSPRKSFTTWIEHVSGHCAPWTELNRQAMAALLSAMRAHYEASTRELSTRIEAGFLQTLERRDALRADVRDRIGGIQGAIAVAIEDGGDQDGRIIALNRVASDALAIAPIEAADLRLSEFEAISGVDFSTLDAPTSFASVSTAYEGLRDYEVSASLEFETSQLAGGSAPHRIRVFEFRDITEARRLEASLAAAKDRAAQDAQLRSEFFAKLGHELRTPLNGLIGLSDLLVRYNQDDLPESLAKKLSLIREASGQMADMVVGALDSAASVHHVDPSAFEPVRLLHSVTAACDLLDAQMRDRGLQIEILGEQSLSGYSDARGLSQVIVSLLSNAAKYSFRDGRITVHLERKNQAFVSVRIEDTGPGMSPDQVARCMTPFIRFAKGNGAGLGLSIANNLMTIMGGVIQIHSTEGQGTQASALIPASPERFGPAGRV